VELLAGYLSGIRYFAQGHLVPMNRDRVALDKARRKRCKTPKLQQPSVNRRDKKGKKVLWITLFIIFTLLLVFVLAAFPRISYEDGDQRQKSFGLRAPAFGLYILGFIGSLLIFSVHIVSAGEVGVVRTFGSITGQVGEGLQITWPWQSVETWNIKVQTVLPESSCSDRSISCLDAFSSESQDVFIRAVVNLKVDPRDVQELARTVGSNYVERLVLPRLHQIVKDTTVKYRSVDIAPHREEIRQAVRERLGQELSENSINVVDLLITNIDFRPEFKQAIEAKVKAEQDALTEQNKVLISKAQAEQAAAVAEGTASRLRIEAQGQADANRLINESLTPLLIQFQAVQKLTDNVQIALIPSGNGVIIDPATLLSGTPAR
jgi:regulator of protease activity HflC (stomatin/prohibitin superfamily)